MGSFILTLQDLVFPNFTLNNDDSKKNFRLLVDIIFFDEDNKPHTAFQYLPKNLDFWQWETPTRVNGLAFKESADKKTVSLDVMGKFHKSDRLILIGQGELYLVSVKVIDMPDNNFDSLVKLFLEDNLQKMLEESGKFGTKLPGFGFIFSGMSAGKISDFLVDRIKLKDKILFSGDAEEPSNNGTFSITGDKGVFKNSKDLTGHYEVNFKTDHKG